MGSRDKGHKETKKPRKDAKKATLTSILTPPPPAVEVIKRGKKEPRADED